MFECCSEILVGVGAIKIPIYVASNRSEGLLKIAGSAASIQGYSRNKQQETERNNGHLFTCMKREKGHSLIHNPQRNDSSKYTTFYNS